MRALILTDDGLALGEAPSPQATADTVVLRVLAAGLNRRDHWIRLGLYAGIVRPCILGSDVCGIVAQAADASLVGQRVIVDPSLGWGDDADAQGRDYGILGMPSAGTLADEVAVPRANLYPAPAHLTDEQAAALPLAGVTAWRALMRQGQCRSGDRVLITGIGGGVATHALTFAVAAGAEVWVTSSKTANIDRAVALGARGGVEYTADGWAAALTRQAGGIDLVVDGAGGAGVNDLLGVVRPGGRLVFYGATQGAVPSLNMHRIFWKQLHLTGSTMGTAEDMAAMVAFVAEHRLVPVVDSVYPMTEAVAAFDRMATTGQFGNLVVRVAE